MAKVVKKYNGERRSVKTKNTSLIRASISFPRVRSECAALRDGSGEGLPHQQLHLYADSAGTIVVHGLLTPAAKLPDLLARSGQQYRGHLQDGAKTYLKQPGLRDFVASI